MEQDINYAMSDVDTLVDVQPEGSTQEVQVEQPADTQTQQSQTPAQEVQTEQPSTLNIEGLGEVTLEQIKEWKQGYMRQSDYTKKTQELARQRKEVTQQPYVPQVQHQIPTPQPYNLPYQPNQQIPSPMFDPRFNPALQRVEELEQSIADRELDRTVSELKQKYPDFDEVKVLNEALARNVTDLEFVYRALRDDSARDMREQIRQEVLRELAETRNGTQTIIKPEATQSVQTVQLTPAELRVAEEMGFSPEEYAKWR